MKSFVQGDGRSIMVILQDNKGNQKQAASRENSSSQTRQKLQCSTQEVQIKSHFERKEAKERHDSIEEQARKTLAPLIM